jgi:hypothetical protein
VQTKATTTFHPNDATDELEIISTFKVVIAYETAAAAVHAKEISERLAAELRLECATWKMDLLAHPPLCERAATAAAQADMIIFATCAREGLPSHVKDWIENWLPRKKRGPAALVALFEGDRETLREPGPLSAYLSKIAQRGGMDFFCNAGSVPSQDFQNAEESRPYSAEFELEETLNRDSVRRGWGIND